MALISTVLRWRSSCSLITSLIPLVQSLPITFFLYIPWRLSCTPPFYLRSSYVHNAGVPLMLSSYVLTDGVPLVLSVLLPVAGPDLLEVGHDVVTSETLNVQTLYNFYCTALCY